METSDDDFARRVRVARVWAGFTRQAEFGEALAKRWPGWAIRTNIKRVELGLKDLDYHDRILWSERIAEFTGVPEWFMLSGWQGASQNSPIDQQLQDLREAVARHEQMLLQPIRDRPAPWDDNVAPADQAATTLGRAAAEARQQQDERPERKPATRRRKQG